MNVRLPGVGVYYYTLPLCTSMLNDTGSTLFNHKAQALEYDPQMHPLKFTDDIRTCASEYPAGRLQVIGYNGTALTDWFIEDCSLLQYTGTQTSFRESSKPFVFCNNAEV